MRILSITNGFLTEGLQKMIVTVISNLIGGQHII